MPNSYLALTIGPIYDTFLQAKKTRTIWAASYFFSWFIGRILEESYKGSLNVLIPYFNTSEGIVKSEYGSGIYADRIYYKTNDAASDEKKVRDIVKKIITEINIDAPFLEDYLNIHIVQSQNNSANLLETLNDKLDQQELRKRFPQNINENKLVEWLALVPTENDLMRIAFDNVSKRYFRSLPEIATTMLERITQENKKKYKSIVVKSFDNDENDLIDKLKTKFPDDFKHFMKYFAVIYADGDNIGKILESIKNDEDKLKTFSQKMIEFGIAAEKIIAAYGGNGIYLGGEDILTFAPVACIKKEADSLQTIFDLVDKLDTCFNNTVHTYANELSVTPLPTMSYGIHISYNKWPLNLSMSNAHTLLKEHAKKHFWKLQQKDGQNKTVYLKNTLSITLRKHSGHEITAHILKSGESWKGIKTIVTKYTENLSKENDKILAGIIHKLNDEVFFTLFEIAARDGKIEAFFQNYFNEPVHTEGEKVPFLKDMRELAQQVIDVYPAVRDEKYEAKYKRERNDARDILFFVFRFIHFIKSERDS